MSKKSRDRDLPNKVDKLRCQSLQRLILYHRHRPNDYDHYCWICIFDPCCDTDESDRSCTRFQCLTLAIPATFPATAITIISPDPVGLNTPSVIDPLPLPTDQVIVVGTSSPLKP